MEKRRPSTRTLLESCPSAKLKQTANSSRIEQTANSSRIDSIERRREHTGSFGVPNRELPTTRKSEVLRSKAGRLKVYPRVLINLDETSDPTREKSLHDTPRFRDSDRYPRGRKLAAGTTSGRRKTARVASVASTISRKTEGLAGRATAVDPKLLESPIQ